MRYIKVSDHRVILGGQVATQAMIDDGWVEYHGEVPSIEDGQEYKMVDGALVVYTLEISPLTQIQNYKDYLSDTDFKMLPSYVPKEGEDLEAIRLKRDQAREYIRETQSQLRQPADVVKQTS